MNLAMVKVALTISRNRYRVVTWKEKHKTIFTLNMAADLSLSQRGD